jgi:RNA polymerase sigma-70 factor, ECF subfamily
MSSCVYMDMTSEERPVTTSDNEGLASFCEAEFPRLVGSLGLFCGDGHLAQELAQEALMRAVRDWSKVRRLDSPTAWVHTVAFNLARSHFRRGRSERRARLRAAALDSGRAAHVAGEPVEVRDALQTLKPKQRTALVLRYYVDLTIEQTAQAMQCSPATVKNLTKNALTALAAQLRPSQELKEVLDG